MKTSYAILGITFAVALFLVSSFVSVFNYGNRAENGIKAQYSNMENVLSAYSAKVTEAAQVPDLYRDDVKEVVTAAVTGRYGDGGSKAVLQLIHEQNPTLDASIYKQIQQIIEGGRDEFKNTQTQFIDAKRAYETALGYLWTGTLLRAAGYPKIDLAAYKPISNSFASDAFASGVDKGVTLRQVAK